MSLFHLSGAVQEAVNISIVEGGMARPVLYGPDYFDYANTGINPAPLGHLGFAGFRVMNGEKAAADWLAFQGASYFRSAGPDGQYGLSARGIALNTAESSGEEFPRFTDFWIEEHGPEVTVHALMDGPSITGVYKFDCMKTDPAIIMNVHCDLFFRADITRLGIAPLTSMYWYGENGRGAAADWRPEVHDSDGLALWTGKGERVWRPLVNPASVQTNSFMDEDPKGFGLMQRDRDFENYQDDGAFYNRRPGLWVEPRGQWGKGAVQLVEIPTANEFNDNIVAYWRPERDIASGDSLSLDYRLFWQDAEPGFPKDIAKVVSTRLGRAGMPGSTAPMAAKRKFVVDFEGGLLSQMPQRFDLKPELWTSKGGFENAYSLKVVGTDRWRAAFDLAFDGKGPIDMRCVLKDKGKPLTETWLYQFFP